MTALPSSKSHTEVLRDLEPAALRRRRASTRRVRLQILEGPDRARTQDLVGASIVVGTARDSDVVLTDPTVSRHHLRLHLTDSILVCDLESRNGTYLGDLQIREALIPLGARLRVGRTVLSLLDADAPDAAAAAGAGTDAGTGLPAVPAPSTNAPSPVEIPGLVGRSDALRDVARMIRQVAPASASVLVEGETGTGKELVARAIHRLGPRAGGPFVVVDSGALSPTLIASELFGHERGAFPGAETRRQGAFELAHGGTLFLDEVGCLPPAIQPALRGVLERRTFRRLGGTRDIEVDVRVVSATSRSLRTDFRNDLYFRLAVAHVVLPPLRERLEDVEALYEHFARQITGKAPGPLSEPLRRAFLGHPWTGNVRELRNVVENLVATGGVRLELPAGGASAAADPGGPVGAVPRAAGPDDVVPYRVARSEAVTAFEHRYVANLIRLSNGNASKAARVAGMDRPYLLSLLRKHGLRRSRDPADG